MRTHRKYTRPRSRSAFLLSACCLAFLLAFPALPAQALPPTEQPMPHSMQRTEMWCWLAVAEMAVRYARGTAPHQCALYEEHARLMGNPGSSCCAAPGSCQVGGSLEDIGRLVASYTGQAWSITDRLSSDQARQYLAQGRVLILRLVEGGQGLIRVGPKPMGHVVVLRGVGPSRQDGPPDLLLNDPRFPGPIQVRFRDLQPIWEQTLVFEPPQETPGATTNQQQGAPSAAPPPPSAQALESAYRAHWQVDFFHAENFSLEQGYSEGDRFVAQLSFDLVLDRPLASLAPAEVEALFGAAPQCRDLLYFPGDRCRTTERKVLLYRQGQWIPEEILRKQGGQYPPSQP